MPTGPTTFGIWKGRRIIAIIIIWPVSQSANDSIRNSMSMWMSFVKSKFTPNTNRMSIANWWKVISPSKCTKTKFHPSWQIESIAAINLIWWNRKLILLQAAPQSLSRIVNNENCSIRCVRVRKTPKIVDNENRLQSTLCAKEKHTTKNMRSRHTQRNFLLTGTRLRSIDSVFFSYATHTTYFFMVFLFFSFAPFRDSDWDAPPHDLYS